MQSAFLFVIASSMGVMFGWQPMPDGSPQYEYVVQLEPELLATMQRGTTIPISSEVPDDIHPISRIRITVGRDDLPRERLPNDPQAAGEREPRDGLVETQYVDSSAGPRYESQQILPPDSSSGQILPPDSSSAQILPPSGRPPSGGDAFGQSLQRSAEQARNTSTGGEILPPTSQIRPPQSAPRYSQPIQSSNEQNGNQADISRLFGPPVDKSQGNLLPVDDRSITSGNRYDSAPTGGGQILPPPRTTTSSADNRRGSSSSTLGSRYERLDEPIPTETAADRTSSPAASSPGVFNAPWPPLERFADAPLAQEWNTQNPPDNESASQPASKADPTAWPSTNTDGSAFDVAQRTTPTSARSSSDSLSFPVPPTSDNASDRPQSPSPRPEIRREMLNQPADAELVNASGDPVRPTPTSTFPISPGQPTSVLPQSNVIAQPAASNTETGSGNGKMFPLLLAWVLLSGSGAGNLYLFWSYLDIRHKYRGLIRSAGRKLGRRSRNDDEDDYDVEEDYDD